MTAKRIDGGVDYVRFTSTDAGEQNKMAAEYETIRADDKAIGYKEHTGGAFGFMGRVTRHALCAQKGEWRMFQVSGSRAKAPFTKFGPKSQATRIDVQFTVKLDHGTVPQFIKACHETALARKRGEGRPGKVKGIQEEGEYQTVYLGRRASDWYIRIYDKQAESRKAEYEDCVRFELEIKGRSCKAIWQHICSEGLGQVFLLSVLEQKVEAYGITIPDKEGWGKHLWSRPKEAHALETTMAWLTKAVAPSVQRVASELGWLQPLITIMSDILSEEESLDVARELAIRWGS